MRRHLLRLAIALAAMAGLSGQALADTKSDIEARYQVLVAAVSAGDGPALKAVITPDYKGADLEGRWQYGNQLVDSVAAGGARPDFKPRLTIVALTETGDTATVTTKIEIAGNPGDTQHATNWQLDSTDVWQRADGIWRLQGQHQDRVALVTDGKVKMAQPATVRTFGPPPPDTFPEAEMGNPQAPVTVIQYGSVACPICALVQARVMPEFIAKYVTTGKVRYIYRPMKTGNPDVAVAGHLVAQCAGKDRYFQVVEAIMAAQGEMDKGGAAEQYVNSGPVLQRIAAQAGLSEEAYKACVASQDNIDRMDRMNQAYLKRDGIQGTPTFVIDGHEIEGLPRDIGFFDSALQPLLK